MAHRPFLILIVIDGFGCRAESQYNAIASADTPRFDALYREQAWTTLEASGPAVGLPEGQMGNSEVGHLNIGAGRVLLMDVMRIDMMIRSGEFFKNPTLLAGMDHARKHRLHLMGLVSDGGVHSHISHLFALLKMAREQNVG